MFIWESWLGCSSAVWFCLFKVLSNSFDTSLNVLFFFLSRATPAGVSILESSRLIPSVSSCLPRSPQLTRLITEPSSFCSGYLCWLFYPREHLVVDLKKERKHTLHAQGLLEKRAIEIIDSRDHFSSLFFAFLFFQLEIDTPANKNHILFVNTNRDFDFHVSQGCFNCTLNRVGSIFFHRTLIDSSSWEGWENLAAVSKRAQTFWAPNKQMLEVHSLKHLNSGAFVIIVCNGCSLRVFVCHSRCSLSPLITIGYSIRRSRNWMRFSLYSWCNYKRRAPQTHTHI